MPGPLQIRKREPSFSQEGQRRVGTDNPGQLLQGVLAEPGGGMETDREREESSRGGAPARRAWRGKVLHGRTKRKQKGRLGCGMEKN